MKTRRSPRNQEILWRALGPERAEIQRKSLDEQIANEERVLADPFMSKSSKAVARHRVENLKRRKALNKGDSK